MQHSLPKAFRMRCVVNSGTIPRWIGGSNRKDMKSPRFVMAASVLAIFIVAFLCVWLLDLIFRNTYASPAAIRFLLGSATILSGLFCCWLLRKGKLKISRSYGYVLLPIVAFIFMAFFAVLRVPFYALLHVINGKEQSYITHFREAEHRRGECAGVNIREPELNKVIRICYPDGAWAEQGRIIIHKESSPYGVLITEARRIRD